MKIILKIISLFLLILLLFIIYFSFIGFETTKFNNQIQNKISEIDDNLGIEFKELKLILDPFKFNISAKTLGPKITFKNKSLEIESIKTNISLKSLINNQFSLEKVEISTKSLEISDTISFVRSLYKIPELVVLEKILKIKGYLIADLKIEFDQKGNLKDNYSVNGFIKDTKFTLFKDYEIDKLNFIFNIKKNDLEIKDLKLKLNGLKLNSKKISSKKIQNEFHFKGDFENETVELSKENIYLVQKNFLSEIDIQKLKFSSKNNFSLRINEKFKIIEPQIISKIKINDAKILNKLSLEKIFPNIKKEISFLDNEINLNYKKNFLSIDGTGNLLLQKTKEEIFYKIKKINEKIQFENSLKIKESDFLIELLNYKKDPNNEMMIKMSGYKNKNSQIILESLSLNEGYNAFNIENLKFDENFRVIRLDKADFNYLDKDKKKNLIKVYKNKEDYIVRGDYFNAENLIENILFGNNNRNYLKGNFKIKLDISKIFLDNEFELNNLKGIFVLNNSKIFKGNLNGDFKNDKKLKFTTNTNGEEKITTLFLDYAKPIIKKYKFIKGFDEGSLDFFSQKKGNISKSTLKIYDFKLKELPVLTKILTLASLQGIADILSGEGIRFNEFEMNFENKNNLMTIQEIYAIGPAISILMDGYVQKNDLISLRGTLVPATTINKVIGSIPILGKILVGSKTGEGVFGVSFKIKGPPNKLETTVDPIKTLTPRFITRTLEKIKKN